MKKIAILLFVFLSLQAGAQNLDTVKVRWLTLQAQDVAWLIGGVNDVNQDSATAAVFRKVRDKVRATTLTTGWTTPITFDSLPGYVGVHFYQMAKSANAGEIAPRYTAITNALSSHANLAYWIGAFDAVLNQDYLRQRDRGRTILMDN